MIWLQRRLNEKGFIYKSSYAGWYAVSDEAYYSAAQVHEVAEEGTGTKIMVCFTSSAPSFSPDQESRFR
jgi:methionyl-tRNA synthetase